MILFSKHKRSLWSSPSPCLSVDSVRAHMYAYRVLDFKSSPKIWSFLDHFSDNLHISFNRSTGSGIQVAFALHVKLSEKGKKKIKVWSGKNNKEKRRRENQINQSIKSYWQTTHLEHQENVQIPFPSRQQLLPFVYRIPIACLETTESRVTQHSNSFSLLSCTTYSSGTHIYSVTCLFLKFELFHKFTTLDPSSPFPLSVNREANVCMLVV